MLQDLRYALRQLRTSPGFAITVVLTLALGIGANTAIFTLVQGILLRSLPVANADRLYRIGDLDDCCVEGGFPGDAGATGDYTIFSYDLYKHLKQSTPEFEELAAVQAGQWGWTVRRANSIPKSLTGEFVTGNYFRTLGVGAYTGRVFADADDVQGAAPATVLSYRLWQNEYGGDPGIVGSTIHIQAKPFTVIGIAPPGFFGDRVSTDPPDFWMPLNAEPYVRADGSILDHPTANWLYPLGRVREGTNPDQLQAKLTTSLRQWAYTQPDLTSNGGSTLIPKQHVVLSRAGGGIQNLQQQAGQGLKMLMILSSVVLLIACANIANLMLARATARRAELAVRMAVGSSRGRVIRQIMTESLLLSLIGGLTGLAVAYGGAHMLLALAFPRSENMAISASPSLPVLGFAFLVSMLTGVLFGTGPAWLSSHTQPAEALRGVNRTTRDRSSLPQKALVVLQAALSLVLLAGAILMTRSLANLENQNFGLATANRYVFHFDAAGAGYTPERLPELYRQMEDHFKAIPGMASIGLGMYGPLEDNNWGECVIQQGHPQPGPNEHCGSTWIRVNTGFLDSIGVPIIRGRGFTEHDTASSPQVAVVNEAFVKRFFAGKDPIGQHFGIDRAKYSGTFEIVGVFRDFKVNNPRGDVRTVFLRPLAQPYAGYTEPDMKTTEAQSMWAYTAILAFHHAPANVDAVVRETLAQVDPNLPVIGLRSFDAQVANNFNGERMVARLTSLFGVLALMLACIGLYGVMSYFVARRSSEIGIRMALGATRQNVIAMVLRGALIQIAFGLALGIPAALVAGHLMASQLYNVGAYDPLALTGATLVLALCATFAGFIPARRAASIDPMRALRTE
jgi:macrolide transport system ATP-binding/permease protein